MGAVCERTAVDETEALVAGENSGGAAAELAGGFEFEELGGREEVFAGDAEWRGCVGHG
jgi:hypothetical protein